MTGDFRLVLSIFRLVLSIICFTFCVPLAICWTIDLHTAQWKTGKRVIMNALLFWFFVAVSLVGMIRK